MASACSLEDFLGSMLTSAFRSPGGSRYFQVRLKAGICLRLSTPTPFNVLFRQHADVSLLRRHFALRQGNGIFTVCPSGRALRLPLRPRLTLIRLALIRNPWSLGGRVSRPPCRYLYLHLLFRRLQRQSSAAFCVAGMLPYQSPSYDDSMSSAPCLCPIIIHAGPLD